jgi:hypothetical protein
MGEASSGYVKSIVTPAPRNETGASGKAPTLNVNVENKSSTMKKQTIFLAGIKLQLKPSQKEYLSLTNHRSKLRTETPRFSGKSA